MGQTGFPNVVQLREKVSAATPAKSKWLGWKVLALLNGHRRTVAALSLLVCVTAALDVAATEEKPVAPSAGPFLPCERRDMLFSCEAEAVIESVGGLEGATLDRLRTALVAARSEGPKQSTEPAAENGA